MYPSPAMPTAAGSALLTYGPRRAQGEPSDADRGSSSTWRTTSRSAPAATRLSIVQFLLTLAGCASRGWVVPPTHPEDRVPTRLQQRSGRLRRQRRWLVVDPDLIVSQVLGRFAVSLEEAEMTATCPDCAPSQTCKRSNNSKI